MKHPALIIGLLVGSIPSAIQASVENMAAAMDGCFYFSGVGTESGIQWEPAAPGWQSDPGSGELKIDLTNGTTRVAVYIAPGNNRCIVTDGQITQTQAIDLMERKLDYYRQNGWQTKYDSDLKAWKISIQNTHLFDIKLGEFQGDSGSSLSVIPQR